MDHPKIGGLSDGAFRLWVQGLAYCQRFLTNGVITAVALRGLRAYSSKRSQQLIDAGLWEIGGVDVRVHDFLEWNDSREHVTSARKQARERMQKLRGCAPEVRANTERTAGEVLDTTPHHTTPPLRSGEQNGGGGAADTRSKRPIFSGGRFVVFDFMLDDLRKMLGPHLESFDLHEWFFTLAAKADAAHIVVPQRDGGKWLMEQTMAEAVRRGLPVATASTGTGKTAGNAAALARFAAKGATA